MARSQIGSFWAATTDATGTSASAPSRDITAGSVVIYRWRYEGDVPALTSFSDGTAATWDTVEYGTNPTVGRAVCLNHPGGTGTIGTVTVGSNRSYYRVTGVELDGTDPAAIDDAPAGVAGTNATVNYTSTGDGTAFAITGYYSGSTTTATSPAVLEDTAHAYSGVWKNDHTGSGSKSMSMTGGSGNTVTLAVVIIDDAGSGTTDYSETVAHGTLTVTGQALTFKLSSVAANGLLTFTGQDVSFTHQTAGAYSVTIEPGLITFSSPESYSALATTIEHGALTFTGQDITGTLETPVEYLLTIDPGVLTFSGRATNLIWSGAAITNVGGTGLSISIRMGL